MKFSRKLSGLAVVGVLALSSNAFAAPPGNGLTGYCTDFDYDAFASAVDEAFFATKDLGFGLPMWATLMDPTGTVCAVYATAGPDTDDIGGASVGNSAWLGSRVISAQKANTANAFSLDGLSIPTGAVTAAVYEGGSLYGLQFSNPVNANEAYKGSANGFGTDDDPLVGKRPGGVNVFGGGIALYQSGVKVGAIGVSGDTSCRDAAMAYNLRIQLGLNTGVAGANANGTDTLYLTPTIDELYEQPECGVKDPNNEATFGVVLGDAPDP